jgi:hypothetical protein
MKILFDTKYLMINIVNGALAIKKLTQIKKCSRYENCVLCEVKLDEI